MSLMDSRSRVQGLMQGWVDLSLRHLWRIIGIATLVFWTSVLFAVRLDLKIDFVELLPTDSPSVLKPEQLKGRVTSYRTLTVAIESPDLDVSMKFADDPAERLRAFPRDRIRYVGVQGHGGTGLDRCVSIPDIDLYHVQWRPGSAAATEKQHERGKPMTCFSSHFPCDSE